MSVTISTGAFATSCTVREVDSTRSLISSKRVTIASTRSSSALNASTLTSSLSMSGTIRASRSSESTRTERAVLTASVSAHIATPHRTRGNHDKHAEQHSSGVHCPSEDAIARPVSVAEGGCARDAPRSGVTPRERRPRLASEPSAGLDLSSQLGENARPRTPPSRARTPRRTLRATGRRAGTAARPTPSGSACG